MINPSRVSTNVHWRRRRSSSGSRAYRLAGNDVRVDSFSALRKRSAVFDAEYEMQEMRHARRESDGSVNRHDGQVISNSFFLSVASSLITQVIKDEDLT